jgi:thiamine-phosphate pyrophosphorylase
MRDRPSAGEEGALWRTAQALNRAAGLKRSLPPLLFFTDPDRTPDPVSVAERLPLGAGIVFRNFGRPGTEPLAIRLGEIARARGLTLLVGQDAGLAARCGAAGVHLPERALAEGRDLRGRRPEWLITGAAHGGEGLEAAAAAGLDAAVLSPVFASQSPSAGAPLGVDRFSALAAGAALPVYALGGVAEDNAHLLLNSGAAGLAGIDAVLEAFGSRRT